MPDNDNNDFPTPDDMVAASRSVPQQRLDAARPDSNCTSTRSAGRLTTFRTSVTRSRKTVSKAGSLS